MRRLALLLMFAAFLLAACGSSSNQARMWVTHPLKQCGSSDCGPYSATLNWSVPAYPGLTGYNLLINGSQEGTASASPFTFTGLDCNTSFTLGVQPHSAGSNGPTYSISYTTPACPSLAPAPTNTAAPYFNQSTGGASCTAGCAIQGQTLSVTTGSWSCTGGCGTLTYQYQWQDCTTTAGQPPTTGSCSNISGATSSSYTVAAGDVGHALSVAVTALNNGSPSTATTTSGSSCNRASLPIPGTGSNTSGTSGAATPNSPAGCSPISAVAAATQAGQKFCTNAPVTCGYPDELVPGMVGPSGALTTVTSSCSCLPSGATLSGADVTISGNNVTLQNVRITGSITITGSNDTFKNSEVDSGTNNITGLTMTIDHDWFQGDANWNVNNSGDGTGTISNSFFNNGCEDVQAEGMTVRDSYMLDNKFFSGCHFEDTYTAGGTSQASTPATDFEHNTAVCNFPDNWCQFLDDHAFSATGAYNVTIDNTLIANDGFYSYGGTTINGGTNNVVTNNRISQAYQSGGGSLGTDGWGVGNSCAGTTYTNNNFDDTLAATSC